MTTPSYDVMIPANIMHDKRLKANEKLMYGELVALSQKDGYCLESNQYFSELYGSSRATVSRWLGNLQSCGYIRMEFNEKDHSSRRIYIVLPEEEQYDIDEKINTPSHLDQYPMTKKSIPHDEKINTHDKKINTHDEKINTPSSFYLQDTPQSTPRSTVKSQSINSPFHSQNTSSLYYTSARNYGEYQGNGEDGKSDFHSQSIPQSIPQSTPQVTPHDENDIIQEKKNKEEKKKQEKKKLEKNNINNIYNNNIYNPPIYKYILPPTQKTAVRHKHGEYNNVLLTDDDYEKLKEKRPDDYQEWIDRLSAYMASTGKVYKNHYVTICNWIRREQKEQEKQAIRQGKQYSYEGGETL